MINTVLISGFLFFAWNVSAFAFTSISLFSRGTPRPSSRSSRRLVQHYVQQSSDVKPAGVPPILQQLQSGDSILGYRTTANGLRNVTVECASETPPVFIMRNLVTPNECQAIQSAVSSMAPAQTASGEQQEEIRKHCQVAWLGNHGAEGLVGRLAQAVRIMMVSPDHQMGVEDLQVVRYTEGGEYALHHDGNDRVLTVLYFLNGKGETWFPFANGEMKPKTRKEALDMAEGLKPGVHGVLVSTCHSTETTSYFLVNCGDAVAFYSYLQNGHMDWSAIHTGLPAREEKVIANHFFRPVPQNNQERHG